MPSGYAASRASALISLIQSRAVPGGHAKLPIQTKPISGPGAYSAIGLAGGWQTGQANPPGLGGHERAGQSLPEEFDKSNDIYAHRGASHSRVSQEHTSDHPAPRRRITAQSPCLR